MPVKGTVPVKGTMPGLLLYCYRLCWYLIRGFIRGNALLNVRRADNKDCTIETRLITCGCCCLGSSFTTSLTLLVLTLLTLVLSLEVLVLTALRKIGPLFWWSVHFLEDTAEIMVIFPSLFTLYHSVQGRQMF